MSKIHKRSLCNIQIYAREKQNRLTRTVECAMIFMLGGLSAACFFITLIRIRAIKNAPLRVPEKPYKSEMTLDYCLFCHDKKHFFVVKGHFCSFLISNIID